MAGMRKFLGGVVSGGLVAGLTLVVASQLSPPRGVTGVVPGAETGAGGIINPQPKALQTDAAPLTDASAPVAPANDAPAVLAAVDPAPVPDVMPEQTPPAPLPVPDTAANLPAPAPAPAPVAVGEADTNDATEPADAEPGATAAGLSPNTVSQVPPLPEGVVSDVPAAPPAAPLTTLPAQEPPAASDAPPMATADDVNTQIAAAPGTLALPTADGVPAGAELPPPPPLTPEEEAILADPARLLVPEAEGAPAAPTATLAADTGLPAPAASTPEAVVAEGQPQPAVPPVTAAATATAEPASPVIAAPEPAPVIVTEAEPDPIPAQGPSVLAVDAVPETLVPDPGLREDGPSTLPATPRLITAGEGALTDRDSAENAADETEVAALPEVALKDGPALTRFAAEFANAEGKPLFGILLMDSGDAGLDRQAVASLPFPVSIVLDPLLPDSKANAALYRAGGKEVLMLASGIPDGATPADLEQTFQAHAAALPEAVAVIDSSASAFQNDRPLSSQIVPILAAQGRGLLTWDRGLNAADQVARREGLPTAMIFRQIDAEGESVPVMRRYLDRAAFKAAQEGQAIVIGNVRPETIAALLEWAIEGRASTVALAPASALLLAE